MARYTYGQLEELWIKAGGSRVVAPLMAAIALAESGGDPAANNYTDNGGTQTSWGLWQVSNGTHSWPGPGNPNDPLVNAKYAVAKYKTQGLTAWGTYDSGAYKQYYRGDVPPGQVPQGGGTQQATDTSVWTTGPGAGFPIPGFGMLFDAISQVWDSLRGGTSSDPLTALAQNVSMITGLMDRLLHAVEWFFVPSHWVRIVAAGFGLMFMIPGLYALMKTGTSGAGDASLAIGILLITLSGVCFFVAFHNLPDSVDNFRSLMGWMTKSIREGRPAAGTTAVTA